ncbi:eukaryotic translation initiation factor 4E-binding protein Mextli isoform X2 [Episyrphus balteatus]|uniref:eukaryotic translation initiation factor 4E-binding protein Mextli isoform X2 n=1 Tax=Episyrphus balteatus TaxID=286459 RepID=UPI002484F452|nr:eukaryotic translation initiation factor 4E-binding protein Mextli isoform X2 [Episyrphus balteatus]
MAHVGRTVKNLEAPRPLKSQSRPNLKNNYMLIEELIQLIENVALNLASGINNPEPMVSLVQNLRVHGPQLENVSKDTLDRAFVVFRNASQDERLNIMTRLNLLELIELRAKGWQDNGFNSYYKSKATNVEPESANNHTVVVDQSSEYLSTSPTMGGVNTARLQQTQLLGPGEIIRNSGKFPKPTKIPGKTYCKDEVVIRNADSGKVNPGAKERLVQITGPSEEKINYAKQLIEDTIRRNASPVRLDPSMGGGHSGGGGAGGSCSSLASSASDEAQPRTVSGSISHNMPNRLSLNSTSAGNFLTGSTNSPNLMSSTPSTKMMRNNQQALLHSFSTNDASLGEYKYTVNVGQHLIKITGDCCDLVRVAKLVLDDYFSSNEFLASVEAGAAFDGSMVSPISTPSTPMGGPPQFIMGTPLQMAPPLADSGIGLNYMAGQISNTMAEGDDDVFVDASSLSNGLARSRRSHFSRKDSVPETNRIKSEGSNADSVRIIHEYEHLLFYSKSPHSWSLPSDWQKICERFPKIIRNKVKHANSNTSPTTTSSCDRNYDDIISTLPPPNIKRKGFFSRSTYSIDEGSSYEFNNYNNNNNNNNSITSNNNNNNDNSKDEKNHQTTAGSGVSSGGECFDDKQKKDVDYVRPKLSMDFRSNSTCD